MSLKVGVELRNTLGVGFQGFVGLYKPPTQGHGCIKYNAIG